MSEHAGIEMDFGPDTEEEAFLKDQLLALQKSYARDAEPFIKRLIAIRNLKVPRMALYPDHPILDQLKQLKP